ncbi:MAG: tetratricopeptide repeat protein [Parachlamydiaceae bacterium]|nr:tetratricopeptide repeat protein [Parachlamydiaceae bacterium]
MIPYIPLQINTYHTEFSNLLEDAIHELVQGDNNRQRWEKSLQLLLNKGMKPTEKDLTLLRSSGYSISYDPQTLEKFRIFVFPNDPEMTIAIQSATQEGGLLTDRHKMYRPGPASVKHCEGAAKGYHEIFAIFEQNTTEKKRIAKDTYNFIDHIEEFLPLEHPWKRKKTLLDIACGNGVQAQELLSFYPCSVIGLDNQESCINECQKLLPGQTFTVHNCFAEAPPQFKEKADILFVSHFYCSPDKIALFIERLQEYQTSENALVVFVNGSTGTDADRIANKLPFLRGKPSSSMSNDFKKALQNQEYSCIEHVSQAKLIFPSLTTTIRHQLLQIHRGDYENSYPQIDPDFKTFKALMEFIASYPLESMNPEEIALYLNELEETFKTNDGPYLLICNQIVLAHPKNADEAFQAAFKQADEVGREDPVFEAIRNKMELGLSAEAKKELGKLLEAIENQDLEKSIAGFLLMSEIHLVEGKYPEAAGILWYAKRLDKEGTCHKKIDAQLDIIERALLHRATNQEGPCRGIEQSKQDQGKLKQLREVIREEYYSIKVVENNLERTKALRLLYQHTITKKLKAFIDEVAQDVVKQMADWKQKTPCDYALIGLGSLAREEMTPYSDFEFAILIDSEKEEDKEYFRLFTNLLHLRFINFGETILPSLDIRCLDWVFDTITPRGLSFDGSMPTACKTPLGKKGNKGGDYELIHNPKGMSLLQHINVKHQEQERLWILKRYHLPSILSTCTYVTGSEKGIYLVPDYQLKVQAILENDEGKQRAFDLMKDDLDNFKPRLEEDESGRHYNVKKDLYRLPNTMFDGLANYFCLKATSTWERIEELEKKEIFTSTAAQDLKELVMLSQELRLSTYLSHDCQKDHLDIDMQKVTLQELYYRVLPFAATMEVFCSKMENGSPERCLQKERFYENTSFHQGVIALRHMDFMEADRCISLEVFDTLEYYEVLASVKNTLAKYTEAEEAYLKAIEKKPSSELYMKLGQLRQSCGRYLKKKYSEGSAEELFFKAKELIEKSLIQAKKIAEESTAQLLLERVYRALTSLYRECGDYASMKEYLRLCKELCQIRIQKKDKDPEYRIVLDLDFAKTKELESKISEAIDSDFKKSSVLFREARKIFKGYYRRKDHPAISCSMGKIGNPNDREIFLAKQQKGLERWRVIFGEKHPGMVTFYHNIGGLLGQLGKFQEALEVLQKALELQRSIFGEQHPDVAISYNKVGATFDSLDRHLDALEHRQKALDIYLFIFGEQHPGVANSYNNVGSTFGRLCRHQKALKYHQKALIMRRSIFGEQHPMVAYSYGNVGTTFGELGRHQEALENRQKAHDIQLLFFDERHDDLAISYNNLGSTLLELGRPQEALVVQQKALEMWSSIFGKQHPQVAISYNNVGCSFIQLGRYHEAIKHFHEALELQRSIFGEKHPSMADSYSILWDTLLKLGRHKEALIYLQKALEIERFIFGEQHLKVALSYSNIGIMLVELNEPFLAASNLKQALCAFQANPSYQLHHKIININILLANSYLQQNNREKCTEHAQEAKKLSTELDNLKTFQKNEILLNDLFLNKKYQEAYKLFTKLPKFLKEAPQFLCFHMQMALLCPSLNKKTLEKHIQEAENALNKGECSIPTRFKLCINLATYWLNQKSSYKWDKANECMNHLQKLLDITPTFCFQYTLLDSLVFGENPLIESECIPAEILRNFIVLKIFEGKGNHQILPIVAKQLLQKIDSLETQGHKTAEIKNFCLECLNEQKS